MPSSWFIVKPDRELGPYTSAQIKQLASCGQLKAHDLVRRADRTKCVAAGKVQGLFPQAQATDRPKATPPLLPSERVKSQTPSSSEPARPRTDPVRERPRTTPPPLPSERKATVMPPSSESLFQPIDLVYERTRTMPPPLPSDSINSGTTGSSGPPPLPSSRPKFDDVRNKLGDLTETTKAAGHLAVAEARKAKLRKLTLPAAYQALGRDIFAGGRFRSEFPEIYAEIERVQVEINRLTTQEVKPRGTFAEQAGQVPSKLKDMAHAKGLGLKVDTLMRRLGEVSYSSSEDKSGPEPLVKAIRECINKVRAADEAIRENSAVSQGRWITPNRLLYGGIGIVALIALLAVFNKPQPAPAPEPIISSLVADPPVDMPTRAEPLVSSPSVTRFKGNHAPNLDDSAIVEAAKARRLKLVESDLRRLRQAQSAIERQLSRLQSADPRHKPRNASTIQMQVRHNLTEVEHQISDLENLRGQLQRQ